MENTSLSILAKEKQPEVTLLCHLAKEMTPTPSLITEIFLPFFKKLTSYEYEIQVQLSEVFSIHGDREQNCYWLHNAKLIPMVEHHWVLSQLMVTPEDAIARYTTYQIKNALHHINCNTRQQLETLLQTLIQQKNTFDTEIVTLVESGIKNAKLTYQISEEVLLYLLSSTQYEVIFSTCELIKKYPFIFSDIPEISLRIVMERGDIYEPLALDCLGTWGNNRIFKEVLHGESWQLESKRVILPFLPLTTSFMDTLAEYLMLYPVYSIDWLKTLLKGAYQGVHVSKKQITKIIEHYFEYEFISARQLVQLLPEALKKEAFTFSLQDANDDFEKRVQLFEELNTPYTRKAIIEYVKETKDRSQLKLLLETIATLKIKEAEPYILLHLEDQFDICLEALKYVGGSKTITHLKQLLEFDVPVKQNIPSFEKKALTLLANLVPDQQIISNYLQKHRLPLVNLPNVRLTMSTSNQKFLLEALDEREIDTVLYAIEKLGELGTIDSLEPVIKKMGMIQVHSQFANPAWEAAQKIANRAYDHHQLKTKKNNRKIVVDTTLTEVILKQFKSPLSEADTILYLQYLTELIPTDFPINKLSILADSPNPHIVKFYISYLGKLDDDSTIKHLKEHLDISQNIYTLRQALLALTDLRNHTIEDLVIPLLGHPNMNIKKTVADYLKENGTVKAVSAMVHLFQRNDNTGLREKLEQGLRNILGEAYYFFLFNECFSYEEAWQRELLQSTITNDKEITEQHYIDFPELNTIVSEHKTASNLKIDLKVLKQWKTIRNRTKEEISLLTTAKELNNSIGVIKKQAEDVYITDLVAASFRRFKETPLSKDINPILTTEEARIAITKNTTNSLLWDCVLLDPESEEIEYNNLYVYKDGNIKEKLFLHFLAHYGLEKMLKQLVDADQIHFLKKIVVSNTILQSKYLPLILHFYKRLKKQTKNKNELSSLEDLLSDHPLINKDDQIALFFLKASIEVKLKKIRTYSSQQQSILKEEIVKLYKSCSWKQRNNLLQAIKKPKNHTALYEVGFSHYLEGKELPSLHEMLLSPDQTQQLEKHPDAIELTKNRTHYLQYHSNDFVFMYVKEITSHQDTDPNLLHSFKQFTPERKWKIIETELEQERWYWLTFFDELTPFNTAIKKIFREATVEGKLELIKHLISQEKQLYFPTFIQLLLPFAKEYDKPIIVWQLLFNLKLKDEEIKELTDVFIEEYTHYNTSIKTELLTYFIEHTIPPIVIASKVFNKLLPVDKKEETLLLQLRLKTLDDKDVQASDKAIQLIKELAKLDISVAKQSIPEVVHLFTEIGLPKQIEILNACYSLKELSNTVSIEIAHIFSTELLALSFLTEENKKQFYKQIGELIKTHTTEIDRKRLLKNIADESPEESNSLLLDILSSKKKTDLDTLCLRLLKKSTSRTEYLDICYNLLHSDKENLFQSIIRTLSFAKYTEAIPIFIKLFTHKKGSISKVAREGLLVMGEKAIPILTKETNKARPDKQVILNELLNEIHIS